MSGLDREWWKQLALDSVVTPRTAGERLLAVDWGRDALWTAAALLAVLNGILYSQTLPMASEPGIHLPPLLESPVALAVFVGLMYAASAWVMTLAGRVLGGAGRFDTLFAATLWLQALRLVLQLLVLALALLSPGLASLLAVVAGFWGIYVLVNFIAAAHGFNNALRGLGTLAIGITGLAIAMSVILALLGGTPTSGGL